MNASSESGLWALTITRGSTDVIRNWDETPPKFTLLRVIAHHRTEKNRVTKRKRAVIQQRVNPETSSAIIRIAHHALGPLHAVGALESDRSNFPYCLFTSRG